MKKVAICSSQIDDPEPLGRRLLLRGRRHMYTSDTRKHERQETMEPSWLRAPMKAMAFTPLCMANLDIVLHQQHFTLIHSIVSIITWIIPNNINSWKTQGPVYTSRFLGTSLGPPL